MKGADDMRTYTLYGIDELRGRSLNRAVQAAQQKYLKHLDNRQGSDVETAIRAFCKTFKTDVLQYDVKPGRKPRIILDTHYFSTSDNEDKNELVDVINQHKEDDFADALTSFDLFGDHYIFSYFAAKSGTSYNELESDIQKAVRFAVKCHLNSIYKESRNVENVKEYARVTNMGFDEYGSLKHF